MTMHHICSIYSRWHSNHFWCGGFRQFSDGMRIRENALANRFRGIMTEIRSVAVSPDGTLIASASRDRTVRMWDSKTGASIGKPLEGHGDDVNSVTFSPDGTKIASGSDDKTIRLWSVNTQAMIGNPFKGHADYVTSVAFSHDGVFIVSGSWDDTIRVWNAETGVEVCAATEGTHWSCPVCRMLPQRHSHSLGFLGSFSPTVEFSRYLGAGQRFRIQRNLPIK